MLSNGIPLRRAGQACGEKNYSKDRFFKSHRSQLDPAPAGVCRKQKPQPIVIQEHSS